MNHKTDNLELKEVIQIIEDNGNDRSTGHNEVKRLITRIRELEKFKVATWKHSCFRPHILNVDQVCDVCHTSIPQDATQTPNGFNPPPRETLLGKRAEAFGGVVGQIVAVHLSGRICVSNENEDNKYEYWFDEDELKVICL